MTKLESGQILQPINDMMSTIMKEIELVCFQRLECQSRYKAENGADFTINNTAVINPFLERKWSRFCCKDCCEANYHEE
jgi:hypothetical protein